MASATPAAAAKVIRPSTATTTTTVTWARTFRALRSSASSTPCSLTSPIIRLIVTVGRRIVQYAFKMGLYYSQIGVRGENDKAILGKQLTDPTLKIVLVLVAEHRARSEQQNIVRFKLKNRQVGFSTIVHRHFHHALLHQLYPQLALLPAPAARHRRRVCLPGQAARHRRIDLERRVGPLLLDHPHALAVVVGELLPVLMRVLDAGGEARGAVVRPRPGLYRVPVV